MYTEKIFAENNCMRKAIKKVWSTFKYYTDKRFSTIAGTLVYFLLMSIAPFVVWLTLLLGNIEIERFLSGVLFESIRPFLNYIEASAQHAASSAGIILIATSLYSSTNFFYHLRRSGEIIFGSARVKGGIKLRILSALIIILTILASAFLAAVTFFGRLVLQTFMPEILCDLIFMLFAVLLTFAIVILLNLFACPYKLRFSEALIGSLLTTVLWLLFIIGFAIYVQFASPGKLYGAISSIIVFLLWCYFMMCCFVIGMIKNGSDMARRQYKKLF